MELKDALGRPNEGFHKARLCGFARNDVLATVVAAWPLSYWLRIPYIWSVFGLFVAGEVLHYLLGVQTAFIKML